MNTTQSEADTLTLYNDCIRYSYNLLRHQPKMGLEPYELAAEAIAQGAKNINDAKKVIRNFVLPEVRRWKAHKQRNHPNSLGIGEKVCKRCKESLPYQMFRPIQDPRTGLNYFNRYCNDCLNADRRARYAKNPTVRESARKRYERYKKRHPRPPSKPKDTIQKKIIRLLNFPKTRQQLECEYAKGYETRNLSPLLSVLVSKGLVDKAPLRVVGDRERFYYVVKEVGDE